MSREEVHYPHVVKTLARKDVLPQPSTLVMPTLYLLDNSRTLLSASEEAALIHLEQHLDRSGDAEHLTRETAIAYLTEQGIERPDARSHIGQLLLKGYLYEVNDELRIPLRV